jgi:N-acetylated-alpha-linked acidic dipeptidase
MAYADRIQEFVREVTRQKGASDELRDSAIQLKEAARATTREASRLRGSGDRAAIAKLNQRLVAFERAFVDPDGIPGRPWYRHQLFAPKYTYAAEVLPALAEALETGDASRIADGQARIARALRRAAAVLR